MQDTGLERERIELVRMIAQAAEVEAGQAQRLARRAIQIAVLSMLVTILLLALRIA